MSFKEVKELIFTFTLGSNDRIGENSPVSILSREIIVEIGEILIQFSSSPPWLLFVWGNNDYAQLGLDHKEYCSKPQEIGGLLKDKLISHISFGGYYCFAICEGNDELFYQFWIWNENENFKFWKLKKMKLFWD